MAQVNPLQQVLQEVFILVQGSPADCQVPCAFNKTDRVYSEEPFAVAFYSEPGVSIDPPFAFGATRPEWRYLIKDHHIDCERILKGGFTHVIEKSLEGEVPSCLRLKAVQNHWRLWEVQR